MDATVTITQLQTRKNDLNQMRLATVKQLLPLNNGEVLLKISRAALTANNITYAAFGDAMQYWDFFPTGDEGWGQMPVWGFADVVASNISEVAIGERFYGYFPLASHVTVQPVRVSSRGFVDSSEHRSHLASVYNQYVRCSQDPAYRQADESYQAVVRPLYVTSFVCADFLQDNQFFGARQVVISSASSKTAYGLAFCLRDQHRVSVSGLTSKQHQSFVEHLDCYQQVVSYEQLASIAADVPTVYVDFSGNEELRAAVHQHFGAALLYDCQVGAAQNVRSPRDTALPGPAPKLFFAPSQIEKRLSEWGPQVFGQRSNEAQLRFIQRVSDASDPWMRLVEHDGLASAQSLLSDMLAGRTVPGDAHVVLLD
ncbi:MAG: DUF2855 family protein [Herbaspirillum sp.]